MYAPNFWFIAIGLISFGLTIQVNGVEVLIPTLVGWCFIAWGCWGLRKRIKAFRPISLIAATLAVLTLPDLFRGAMHSEGGVPAGLANYDLIFSYPVWILGNYVIVAILAFIAFEADCQARNGISVLAIAAMMHTVTVELLFSSSHSHSPKATCCTPSQRLVTWRWRQAYRYGRQEMFVDLIAVQETSN